MILKKLMLSKTEKITLKTEKKIKANNELDTLLDIR